MIDQMDDGLLAAIKALDEVVAPALDATNPLAVEQLRLVSRFLGFVRARRGLQWPRDEFELRHQLALAGELLPMTPASHAGQRERLARASEAGRAVAQRDDASQEDVRNAIDGLTAALAALVRAVAVDDDVVRRPIERAVVLASKSLYDAHRAWFLPMGFEPDPKLVPPLDAILAGPR